jgi:hypothetical protein
MYIYICICSKEMEGERKGRNIYKYKKVTGKGRNIYKYTHTCVCVYTHTCIHVYLGIRWDEKDMGQVK